MGRAGCAHLQRLLLNWRCGLSVQWNAPGAALMPWHAGCRPLHSLLLEWKCDVHVLCMVPGPASVLRWACWLVQLQRRSESRAAVAVLSLATRGQ